MTFLRRILIECIEVVRSSYGKCVTGFFSVPNEMFSQYIFFSSILNNLFYS